MAAILKISVPTYHDATGRRCKAGDPGAIKTPGLSRKWYGQGIPGLPPKKRVPLCENRAAAQRMLDDLVRRAEQGLAGIPDAAAARRTLPDLLAAFEADLALGLASRSKRPRAPNPKQVALVSQRVKAVLDAGRFVVPADMDARAPAKVATWLQDRVRRKSLSHQSADFHLAAVRRFVWWLSKSGLPVRADLFDAVPGFEPRHNRVHARRWIATEELAGVLAAALAGKPAEAMPGEARYHLYLTAFSTGFRAGELAALEPHNFELDAEPPCVTLAGWKTKNRQAARVPIPPAVAVQLRRFISERPPGPVWPSSKGGWAKHAAEMLKVDLAAAGVPYCVDGPHGKEYADFHALRSSFVSALAAAGVGPKELQELARHSDPRLTLGVYAKTKPAQLGAAAARLPLPIGKPEEIPIPRDQLAALVVAQAAVIAALLGSLHPGLHPESAGGR